MREKFGTRHFVYRQNDEPIGKVTFPAGVANVVRFEEGSAALAAADEALYRAKESSRHQIQIA